MSIIASILTGGANSHETTSEEANGVYTDFVSEGVVGTVGNTSGVAPATGGFSVNAQGSPDMTVAVGSGVAYVTGTPSSQNSQTFRIKNSASSNVTISANSSGSTKYDWVYISLNATNLNTPNTAGDNVATLTTSRSSSASSDDGTPPTYGYPLAVVTVANGASSITNGNIRDIRNQVSLNTGTSNANDGWTSLSGTTLTTATGYNKGQKEYDLTSSADMTAVLSPGMRLKMVRGVTPPTQCFDAESSSSQYASKTSPSGLTFTDDFTCEAWVKLESYGANGGIIARRNADTEGWSFGVGTNGQLEIFSLRIASNFRQVLTYQSIPLGVWTHVAATMDNSGTTYTTYINGVSVPNVATTTGTITALVQGTTALVVGARKSAGTEPFDGEIADVRVWSAIRTATQIRDNMNQQLVGNETNLVAYFKLDGNFNDSTANANNATGSGGAVATTVDNPMKATEYAIITKVTASTITVFTGTDYNIPNITLSTPYYSSQTTPFGFPRGDGKWVAEYRARVSLTQSSPTGGTWYNLTTVSGVSGGTVLTVPTGEWELGYESPSSVINNSQVGAYYTTLSTSASTESDRAMTCRCVNTAASANSFEVPVNRTQSVALTAATPYYLNIQSITASATQITLSGVSAEVIIRAKCAYI